MNRKIFFKDKTKSKDSFKFLYNIKEGTDETNVKLSFYDSKDGKKETIVPKSGLKKYLFIEKTKNKFYKKYKTVSEQTLLTEMDSAATGLGGFTQDHGTPTGDNYAPGDARNPFGVTPQTTRRSFPETLFSGKKTKAAPKKKKTRKKDGKEQEKPDTPQRN